MLWSIPSSDCNGCRAERYFVSVEEETPAEGCGQARVFMDTNRGSSTANIDVQDTTSICVSREKGAYKYSFAGWLRGPLSTVPPRKFGQNCQNLPFSSAGKRSKLQARSGRLQEGTHFIHRRLPRMRAFHLYANRAFYGGGQSSWGFPKLR